MRRAVRRPHAAARECCSRSSSSGSARLLAFPSGIRRGAWPRSRHSRDRLATRSRSRDAGILAAHELRRVCDKVLRQEGSRVGLTQSRARRFPRVVSRLHGLAGSRRRPPALSSRLRVPAPAVLLSGDVSFLGDRPRTLPFPETFFPHRRVVRDLRAARPRALRGRRAARVPRPRALRDPTPALALPSA